MSNAFERSPSAITARPATKATAATANILRMTLLPIKSITFS